MEKESVFEKPLEMDHREPAAAVDAADSKRCSGAVGPSGFLTELRCQRRLCAIVWNWHFLRRLRSNLQPWEFYWVRSPEKRKELDRLCMSQPAATTAAEIVIAVARTDTWRKNSKQMLEVFDSMAKKTGQKLPKPALDYYRKLVPFAYSVGWFSVLAPIQSYGHDPGGALQAGTSRALESIAYAPMGDKIRRSGLPEPHARLSGARI